MLNLDHLPNQKKFEKTVFSLRKHYVIPLKFTLLFIILAAIPVGFYFFIKTSYPGILTGAVSYPVFILALSAYCLAILLFYFNNLIDYYLDVWVVTNERIINIEQKGLFARTTAELKLYRVQDAQAEVKGILHTLLDYGNITVQTAGEEAHFTFKHAPDPYKVSRQILELVEDDRQKHLDEIKQEQVGT
ncbi:PH domain-containing protein [Patescibacteria group bacterium]|nr:PH domain-containing protein [Patescibacteria group bacterium]MBU1921654.1 PH domain-containing protein [Patescibacteria group bacterium]